jgi:hypothetical protein
MSMKSITVLGFAAALMAFGAAPASACVCASTGALAAYESTAPRHEAAPSDYRRVSSYGFHRSSVRAVSFHRFHRSSVRTASFHHRFHRSSVRTASFHHRFHGSSGRHVSLHRHHHAWANARIGGGHRATPVRTQSPRLTYNNRVQSPRVVQQRPQVRPAAPTTTPRPNWRNNPILNVRSG